MKRPAIFFDRDNTLIVSDGYLGDPEGVVLVEGAADLVARVRRLGYVAVTFSNQSGVARGLFTEQDVHRVNSRLDEMLLDHEPGAVIDRHEFCPHHPEAVVSRYRQASEFRKPSPGMIYQAARQLGLDLNRSWVVGDAPRDIEAGRAAGCRTILLKDPALPRSAAARELLSVEPDFVAANLKEVADLIENNPSAEETREPALIAEDQQGVPVATERGTDEVAAEESLAVEAEGIESVVVAREHPVIDDAPPAEGLDELHSPEVVTPEEQSSREPSRGLPAAAIKELDSEAQALSPEEQESGSGEPELGSEEHGLGADEQGLLSPEHEPGLQELEQSLAAPVEAVVHEESVAAPEQGSGQSAEEQVMDEKSRPGPAPTSGADSEGVRRRSPPAVILAAKAAREAARHSVPDASAEILREVARNAARESAMGITRDYSAVAPGAAPAASAADGPSPVVDAAAEASVQPSQPAPEVPMVDSTNQPPYANRAAPAYRPAVADRSDGMNDVPRRRLQRLENIAEQILLELRQKRDTSADFSVSKMMAGITMVVSLALLVYAYFYKNDLPTLQCLLLLGLMLQSITISLLLMGRQK